MNRVVLIFGVLSFIGLAACKRNEGCNWTEKAWIEDYSQPGTQYYTCGIVIRLEDGTRLEPVNLSKFESSTDPFQDGDLVWVSYKKTSGSSTCGMGEVVKLRCIPRRPY